WMKSPQRSRGSDPDALSGSRCSGLLLLRGDSPAPGLQLQVEGFAEIHTAHLRIVAELLGTSVAEYLAVVNNIGAVRHRQRLANIMIGHKNANAGVLQLENDPLQLENLNGIDTGKRLVE